jgi:hypothetical protein
MKRRRRRPKNNTHPLEVVIDLSGLCPEEFDAKILVLNQLMRVTPKPKAENENEHHRCKKTDPTSNQFDAR